MTIVYSVAVVGAVGLLIGILLGIAGKIFYVEVDERIPKVRAELPGNNCGGCGYAGCDALAKAIVEGTAPPNACPGCNDEDKLARIGAVLGIKVEASAKQVMHVKCDGSCGVCQQKYSYYGEMDCKQAAVTPGGGPKACSYGCLGFGSCVKVCDFDAIHIVKGIAKVNEENCINCGKCMNECPVGVIERITYNAARKVKCNNHDKGKAVKDMCKAGCIACGLCAKLCEQNAISMVNNLPEIDLTKCNECGKCYEKCPTKVIV